MKKYILYATIQVGYTEIFMRKIKMYTDGACKGNPGAGGYACILVFGEHEKVLSGGEAETTEWSFPR